MVVSIPCTATVGCAVGVEVGQGAEQVAMMLRILEVPECGRVRVMQGTVGRL